jgi:hypothetical protein
MSVMMAIRQSLVHPIHRSKEEQYHVIALRKRNPPLK